MGSNVEIINNAVWVKKDVVSVAITLRIAYKFEEIFFPFFKTVT